MRYVTRHLQNNKGKNSVKRVIPFPNAKQSKPPMMIYAPCMCLTCFMGPCGRTDQTLRPKDHDRTLNPEPLLLEGQVSWGPTAICGANEAIIEGYQASRLDDAWPHRMITQHFRLRKGFASGFQERRLLLEPIARTGAYPIQLHASGARALVWMLRCGSLTSAVVS